MDWSEFVKRVADSFTVDVGNQIATIFNNLYGRLDTPYRATGSPSEATLLNLIEHVEASSGKTAKIFGTRTALRKIPVEQIGDEIKSDFYNFGYIGKFNGTECFAIKNFHKPGTTDFGLNDTDLLITSGDDKFIKLYHEGNTLIHERDAFDNADMTQEYVMLQKYGVAVAFSEDCAVYRMA